jgi:glutamate-5-semialdehyde dehydrogenase
VEIRADETAPRLASECKLEPASERDWTGEYLRLGLAIRVGTSVEHAIAHINPYAITHSEATVTRNEAHARLFLRQVDSAGRRWVSARRSCIAVVRSH